MKKKLILLFLLVFALIPNVFAENIVGQNNAGNVVTYSRDSAKNHGVNKKWKITDKNLNNVLRTPLVDVSKKIYDFSGVLSSDEQNNLKKMIDEFINKYNTELIIVTYDLPYTTDKENEDFAADFYDYNNFGLKYEKYEGILLFRNTYSADPYFDMYTFGEAQLYFSHSDYDNILDFIYPNLKDKRHYEGFSEFISSVTAIYERGQSSELKEYIVDENGFLKKIFYPSYFIITIISVIITACMTGHFIKKNKMVKKAVEATTYLDKNSINYSVKEDNFLRKHVSSYTVSSSGGSGGGGGYSSSSGSSGGGHSSGGGRHG